MAMMNKRPSVCAAFAEGEDERYLRAVGAEGITRMGAGETEILLRVDVATRATAFHEWLHRCLTLRHGGFTDGGQDALIEAFLERHRKVLRLDG
ncbi:MAG: hypothetical protein HY332_16340 [Chloroflexi bacterium]|nr:hypothetical protein [Chloroflexota bacterium]